MTDFSNLIDWASRVYPIENYDTYEEWEQDVTDDLTDSGHMPKKTDNLYSQMEQFWKSNAKGKPLKEKELELPERNPEPELPERNPEPELPREPEEEPEQEPVKKPEPEPERKPTKKPSIGSRVKGFFSRFRRRKD